LEYYLKGLEYAQTDPVASLGYFKRACEGSINFPIACLKAVEGLRALKENDAVDAILQKLLEQNYSDLSIRLTYSQFLIDEQRFEKAGDVLENSLKALTLSAVEADNLQRMGVMLKEKVAIKTLLTQYFSWHHAKAWTKIYDSQSQFLKTRVSKRMFAETCEKNYSLHRFDGCKVEAIELDVAKMQAAGTFSCLPIDANTGFLPPQKLWFTHEEKKWKLIASENKDVFDDFMQHQKE
jgi:hypothetical protein